MIASHWLQMAGPGSGTAVPEPAGLALGLAGSLFLLLASSYGHGRPWTKSNVTLKECDYSTNLKAGLAWAGASTESMHRPHGTAVLEQPGSFGGRGHDVCRQSGAQHAVFVLEVLHLSGQFPVGGVRQ